MGEDTDYFTPECTHCNDTIRTDQLCFQSETTGEYYHRDCYHDIHTHECEHCTEPINLHSDTAIPTKEGYYHESCHLDANADEHCNNCDQRLISGRNLRRTTDENGNEIYVCTDCWADVNTEKARELLEVLEEQFDATHSPSREEQERLGLYETPDGWKQEDLDE